MDAEAFSPQPYLTYEELMGEKLPANELIAHISTVDFDFAIRSVAMLASIVANYGGPRSSEARKNTFFELAGYKTVNPQLGAVVDRLRALPPGRVIAHEEGLAYLTALIISFAIEGGRKCSPAEMTFLALATNDYLVGAHSPEDGLTELESLMADVVRIGRFNWNHDSAAEFARGCALMRQHPKRGSWKTHEDWISLQRNAFGMTLDEYLENYLGPLLLFSKTWGRLNKDQKLLAPIVNVKTWLSQANADQEFATQFVDSLCALREISREKLLENVQADGLPRSFGPLYERPLLRLSEDVAIALSPWILKEQLRVGTWARLRSAAASSGSTQRWTSSFGDVFDMWVGGVARLASNEPDFTGHVTIPSSPGASDEFEDVVLVEQDVVVLFSAKGSLVRADIAKPGGARRDVIDWYERFFFANHDPKNKEHSAAGAIRLLNEKIDKIRAGDSPFDRNASVIPVIVTFDELSAFGIVYKWLDSRCKAHGLLRQPKVAPAVIASIGEYESLMALGAHGRSISGMLNKMTSDEWRTAKMDGFLHDQAGDEPSILRLQFLNDEFVAFSEKSKARLFPGAVKSAPLGGSSG